MSRNAQLANEAPVAVGAPIPVIAAARRGRTRIDLRLSGVLTLMIVGVACREGVVAPEHSPDTARSSEVAEARSGPVTQKVDFTIGDVGTSLVSDGKGTYRNGICGVVGTWTDILHLAPAGASVPKAQKAACTGIAPRAATLTLAVRHVSDSPHVDDAASPAGSGVFSVQNVKFGFGSAAETTINATPSCGTLGLRFSSVTYPGSDNVIRTDLGGGLWHMYSRPFPDNRAYCANGTSVTYWHVSMDLRVQIVN